MKPLFELCPMFEHKFSTSLYYTKSLHTSWCVRRNVVKYLFNWELSSIVMNSQSYGCLWAWIGHHWSGWFKLVVRRTIVTILYVVGHCRVWKWRWVWFVPELTPTEVIEIWHMMVENTMMAVSGWSGRNCGWQWHGGSANRWPTIVSR